MFTSETTRSQDLSPAPAPPRERILEAALVAIGEDGYSELSVRRIIEISRAGRRTFYRHFSDKEECAEVALAGAAAALTDQALRAASGESAWREQVRAALRELLGYLDDNPAQARALFVEIHAVGGEAVLARVKAMDRLAAALDTVREGLPAGQGPPPLTASAVIGGMDSAIHSRVAGAVPHDLKALEPELMHFAVLSYLGSEEAGRELAGRPDDPA